MIEALIARKGVDLTKGDGVRRSIFKGERKILTDQELLVHIYVHTPSD